MNPKCTSLLLAVTLMVLMGTVKSATVPVDDKADDSKMLRYLTIKSGGGDSDLGISSVGKGKGSKGSKGSKSSSGKGKGNAFDHDDECYCERRRRRLGIGYKPPPPCECPDGKGSKGSKGSKSSSGKGSGKGGSRSGDSEDDDKDGNSHPVPTKPPSHAEPTRPPASQPVSEPSQASQPSTPSQPQPSSVPNALPTRPRPSPTSDPTPTSLPPSEREPSSPTNPTPTTGGGTPTEENQPTPGGGTPTEGNQPTPGGSTPTPGSPTPDGGTPPTTNPPPSQGTFRCQVSTQGLFGSRVGLSEEFAFSYQTLVIPSVTVPELNIDVLPNLEQDMGNEILSRTFPQCSSDPVIAEGRGVDASGSSQQQQQQRSNAQDDSVYISFNSGQRLLQSSGSEISGFSTRPRDVANEGFECTGVEPVFPCYVIDGTVTVYSSTKLDEEMQQLVRNAIRESIESGNLENSDNRLVGVTWRGNLGGGDGNGDGGDGGGDNNGGGDGDGGGDGTGGNGDGDGSGGTPNGGNGEIDRADTTGGGLQPWMWVIIAIGGFLVLSMLYFCFRRPQRRVDVANDDAANRVVAPRAKETSHHSDENSGEDDEDDEDSVHDVYTDDYDEARATPLIQNTSSRARSLSDEPIEEEPSDADVSYEDLKSPEPESYGVSNSIHSSHHSGGGSRSSHSSYEQESMQEQSYQQSKPVEYDLSQREMPEDLVADTEKESPSAIFGSKDHRMQKQVRDNATMEETSDSAYSSYEDVVEEEYEIEYVEDSYSSNRDGSGHHWADEHADEDDDMANSADASSSLPMLAHSAQLGRKSSFDSMRKKWENS